MVPNPSQCQLAGARSPPWHERVHFQCPDATCVLRLMQARGHPRTALPVHRHPPFVPRQRSTEVRVGEPFSPIERLKCFPF